MKYPIIYIEYRDITIYAGQRSKDDPVDIHIFNTVGFLIDDGKDRVIICQEFVANQNEDQRGTMVIPKENILAKEVVRET